MKYPSSLSAFFPLLCAALPLTTSAQSIQPDDVDWGRVGSSFPGWMQIWNPGEQFTSDDNFFISRVHPHERITNTATQVWPDLMDRDLCYWVPCGTLSESRDRYGQSLPQTILPNGTFDADVFSMWPYVTHWGVWTVPFVRMPGNLADVAHRNGVAVSCTADIPTGTLNGAWSEALTELTAADSLLLADLLAWYGVDGLGYNSEFASSASMMQQLQQMHERLYRGLRASGRNPLFDIIWYDGCTSEGRISYDQGLWKYNVDNFGDSAHVRSNFFFNYNWNEDDLLIQTQRKAAEMGRSTRDIYCGFNMQGREPKMYMSYSQRWPLLARYPFSIGLWGAHNESMMWESRDELGASPRDCQRTYLMRQERWFTGGTRNPISSPDLSNSMRYDALNCQFMGMSRLMTARSPLGWDIHEEPFITHFNLGNGTFLNYDGQRQHDQEWSNIGVQDLLPTWRFWFSTDWLGRDAESAQTGLDAEFTWSDAYLGGSCLRLCAATLSDTHQVDASHDVVNSVLSTESAEGDSYLHLFKTAFSVTTSDSLTLRLKRRGGSCRLSVVVSMVGDEGSPLSLASIDLDTCSYNNWTTLQTILPEGCIALLALHVEQPTPDLDLLLGELSLCPATPMPTPATPQLSSTSLLRAGRHGADAKLIWSMPNDIEPQRTCYNLDVDTHIYNMYMRPLGGTPRLMGITTSWAGLLYSCPVSEGDSLQLGVSAVSLDMKSQSPIAWGPMLCVRDVWQEEADDTIVPEELPAQYGRLPEILMLDVETFSTLSDRQPAQFRLSYEGVAADGSVHAGIDLDQQGYGVLASDSLAGLKQPRSFSVEAWLRPSHYWKATHLMSIRDKTDSWFANECGFFWHFLTADGHSQQMAFRSATGSTIEVEVPSTFQLPAQRWSHVRYDFIYDASAQGWQVNLWLNDSLQCTSPLLTELYPWRQGNVVSFGGHQYTHAGMDGVIDGFRLLVEGEEVSAEAAHRFHYVSGEDEGAGTFTSLPNVSAPGCPWLATSTDDVFPVTTLPNWEVPGADIVETMGNDLAGEALVRFTRPGTYEARLTLRNGYGSSSRSYPLIIVAASAEAIQTTDASSDGTDGESVIYNLWGQRVSSPTKGSFLITNGRKRLLQ